MNPLLQKVYKLSLRNRFFCALILGALMALSQAPICFFPIVCISFTGLLLISDSFSPLSLKKLFGLGWAFGFGYHTAGLYWIAFALGIDIQQFWWLVPFTVIGLPAFLALWSGLALLIWGYTSAKEVSRVFWFAALWSIGEWARGHILTGFPWNLIGYTWLISDEMLQITSIIGIYGLTVLTVLMGCIPYIGFKVQKFGDIVVVLLIFLTMGGYGVWRLHHAPMEYHENIILRLVQPNITQSLKWDEHSIKDNYLKLLSLSALPQKNKVTHIIWPESALPFYLEEDDWRREEIMRALPKNVILLTGGLRRKFEQEKLTHIWNSFLVIGPKHDVLTTYDKSHLVPFGEYIPLREWVPDLVQKVTYGSLDFSSGLGPRTLQVHQTPPFSALICYEAIFPGQVVTSPKPQWMVNVTNDAWYGTTSGPFQHFGIIRVRAIEEGIPMVRVANTGISGVFDVYGRVEKKLNLNETGIIDTPLPKALDVSPFYAHYKEGMFALILLLMVLRGVISWKLSNFSLKKKNRK